MNKPDHYETLAAARPGRTTLDELFPADEREVMLSRIQSVDGPATTSAHPKRAHTRTWVRWLSVAAAAAVIGAGILLRDATSVEHGSRADAIVVLAQTAADSPDLTIPERKFLERVSIDNPNGLPMGSGAEPDLYPFTYHSWTAADGRVWRCDIDATGYTDYLEFPPPMEQDRPAAVAALPTNPEDLMALADSRATGSNSHNEAIFVFMADLLRRGYVPPSVQQAAIESLATLDEVTAESGKSPTGNQRLEVRFHDPSTRGPQTQSLWFDESTGQLVEASSVNVDTGQLLFSTTYGPPQLVDTVPEDVRALTNLMDNTDSPPVHDATDQPVTGCL